MWNKYLQEVTNKLVTTLREMPPDKRAHILTLVEEELMLGQFTDPKRTLTNPVHEWILPPGDLQRMPYIPPLEQRVEQRGE
jgi:hypothetical protein